MDYKCLKNNVKLYYYPEYDKKLVLYLNHPYYIMLFLLIEMHFSDFKIEYKFQNYFTLIIDSEYEVNEIIEMISIVLSTLLDYYVIDYDLYEEILKHIQKDKYYSIIEYMFPNYNYIFDYNKITYDCIKKGIKYFLKNNQIYFVTNSKKIFDNEHFMSIKKIIKQDKSFNNYIIPYKTFSKKSYHQNLIGIYLDTLEYNEHYILDLLILILEKKYINCDITWISQKFKILIIPYIKMNTLKKYLINIYKHNFEILLDYGVIIKKKSILDIINFKNFNINIYQQITKQDIINLTQKIFKHDNIKYFSLYDYK